MKTALIFNLLLFGCLGGYLSSLGFTSGAKEYWIIFLLVLAIDITARLM